MATPQGKKRNLWYTLSLIADLAIMRHSFKAIAITIDRVYMDSKAVCCLATYKRIHLWKSCYLVQYTALKLIWNFVGNFLNIVSKVPELRDTLSPCVAILFLFLRQRRHGWRTGAGSAVSDPIAIGNCFVVSISSRFMKYCIRWKQRTGRDNWNQLIDLKLAPYTLRREIALLDQTAKIPLPKTRGRSNVHSYLHSIRRYSL
jgi:hypothetical protein